MGLFSRNVGVGVVHSLAPERSRCRGLNCNFYQYREELGRPTVKETSALVVSDSLMRVRVRARSTPPAEQGDQKQR